MKLDLSIDISELINEDGDLQASVIHEITNKIIAHVKSKITDEVVDSVKATINNFIEDKFGQWLRTLTIANYDSWTGKTSGEQITIDAYIENEFKYHADKFLNGGYAVSGAGKVISNIIQNKISGLDVRLRNMIDSEFRDYEKRITKELKEQIANMFVPFVHNEFLKKLGEAAKKEGAE